MLAAGTPTNHTPGARVEPPPPATGEAPAAGTDGARLASALGMDVSSFAPVSGTAATTEPAVEAMHTALWPATFGYFLDEVMDPLVSDAAIAPRQDAVREVRPRRAAPSRPWRSAASPTASCPSRRWPAGARRRPPRTRSRRS